MKRGYNQSYFQQIQSTNYTYQKTAQCLNMFNQFNCWMGNQKWQKLYNDQTVSLQGTIDSSVKATRGGGRGRSWRVVLVMAICLVVSNHLFENMTPISESSHLKDGKQSNHEKKQSYNLSIVYIVHLQWLSDCTSQRPLGKSLGPNQSSAQHIVTFAQTILKHQQPVQIFLSQ